MMDLVEFIRAQLDEDERVAAAAAPGPWEYQDIDSVGGGRVCDPTVAFAQLHWDPPGEVDPRIRRTFLEVEADATGEHIARHDPARVLAEVEAKRDMLDACETNAEDGSTSGAILAKTILPLLALPYADRPGYRDEWRP